MLCPKIGSNITLLGKAGSRVRKDAQLVITKCTENNEFFPNTTCAS